MLDGTCEIDVASLVVILVYGFFYFVVNFSSSSKIIL